MVDRPVYSRSTRSVVRCNRGMIATSQPLASAAGLKILLEGGNAIDAAIAAVAVLSVVEPFNCGIGGDAFALLWSNKEKKLIGLNGSGRSPYEMNGQKLVNQGHSKVPSRGVLTVTVPGAVDAWCSLSENYGSMDLKQLLKPAVLYAREGFPVTEIISQQWKGRTGLLLGQPDARRTYLISDRAPEAGEVFTNENLAKTYELLGDGGREAFYEGEIAKLMCSYLEKQGGCFTLKDFQDHASEWVQPISTTYRGYTVFELPPNCQGATVLEMLNIVEGFDVKAMGHNSAEYIHCLVEAKKIAFKDRALHIADPSFSEIPTADLISKTYANRMRKEIDLSIANPYFEDEPHSSDTVYLSVVDEERNCVSFINSLYEQFGSGLVVGDTGIILQNRGTLFTLDPGHPNYLEPHKRPFHTIIPAMVIKNDLPWLCFGVMGGHMQPQGHVQILLSLIDFNMNVQEAGEVARSFHSQDGIAVESEISWDTRMKLIKKGHKIINLVDEFGGYQGIMIDPDNGALAGGSDPRKDGCAIGY